jgi:ADP-ribose pyrophosphatase YjhB (NUDIX family)
VINLHTARINTAGAFVLTHGYYPFATGERIYQGRIPVIRLGGHCEEHETGWGCAAREVFEEASLQITPLAPPTTYLADGDHLEADLQEIQWDRADEPEIVPYLVVFYRREEEILLSLLYLAQTEQQPAPSSEVKGLLLLDEEKIHWLCRAPHTLAEYLREGGKAILSGDFDESLILEPFTQLRLLSRILEKGKHHER